MNYSDLMEGALAGVYVIILKLITNFLERNIIMSNVFKTFSLSVQCVGRVECSEIWCPVA